MTVESSTASDSTPQARFVQIIGNFADAVANNFKLRWTQSVGQVWCKTKWEFRRLSKV